MPTKATQTAMELIAELDEETGIASRISREFLLKSFHAMREIAINKSEWGETEIDQEFEKVMKL